MSELPHATFEILIALQIPDRPWRIDNSKRDGFAPA